jgi:hypothetical protein
MTRSDWVNRAALRQECVALAVFLLASCQSQEAMPKKWDIRFDGKTIGDLESELGLPQAGGETTLVLKLSCPCDV